MKKGGLLLVGGALAIFLAMSKKKSSNKSSDEDLISTGKKATSPSKPKATSNKTLPSEALAPIDFDYCLAKTGDVKYKNEIKNSPRNEFRNIQMINDKGAVVAESSEIDDYGLMVIDEFDISASFDRSYFRVEANMEDEEGCPSIPSHVDIRVNFKDGHSETVRVKFTRGLGG